MLHPRHVLALLLALAAPAAGQLTVLQPSEGLRGKVVREAGSTVFQLKHLLSHAPVLFRVPTEQVSEGGGGWTVRGDLALDTPLGPLPILGADLFFGRDERGRVASLRGSCEVPPPFVSERVRISSPARAQIGYSPGGAIDIGVPLQRERSYLFFDFSAGLSLELLTALDGTPPITLTVPGGIDGTLILDPTDTFYFLGGAFLPKDPSKKREEIEREEQQRKDPERGDARPQDRADDESPAQPEVTGRGRSHQGLIPFLPICTEGVEDQVMYFSGHELQCGVVPIGQLPLEVNGSLITRFDAGLPTELDPAAYAEGLSYHAGANGILSVAFPFAKVTGVGALAEFGFELGQASAGARISLNHQSAFVSGVLRPDFSWLPGAIPLTPRAGGRVVGFVSEDVSESMLEIEGLVGLDVGAFAEGSGLDLGASYEVEAYLRADRAGVVARGRLRQGAVGPIAIQGEVGFEAKLAGGDSRLVLNGAFGVNGQTLDGTLTVSSAGVQVDGVLRGDLDLTLTGALVRTADGLALRAAVTPPTAWSEALQAHALDAAKAQRASVDVARADLEAATKDLELELSLRGLRTAIPPLCDKVIAEVEKQIPKNIQQDWPKALGKEVPGRKGVTKAALKKAKPMLDRLRRLARAAQRGTDAQFRAELKAALTDLINNPHLEIKVKVVGTIYKRKVLNKDQLALLRKALAAVDAIPAASNRRISAAQALEAVPVDELLDRIRDEVEAGLSGSLPAVESATLTVPLRGGGATAIVARIRAGGRTRDLRMDCDLRELSRVGPQLVRTWAE